MIFWIFILLNAYAYYEGIVHAILYSLKGADSLPIDEHRYYVICRALLCASVFFGTFLNQQDCAVLTLCFILSFSFWHNGAYYIYRTKIDPTQETDWFSQSKTDTSKVKFGFLARTITFVLSIIILITYTIL